MRVERIRETAKKLIRASRTISLNEDGTEKEIVYRLPITEQGGRQATWQFTVPATECYKEIKP